MDRAVHHDGREEACGGRCGEGPEHPALTASPAPRAEQRDRDGGGHQRAAEARAVVGDEGHQAGIHGFQHGRAGAQEGQVTRHEDPGQTDHRDHRTAGEQPRSGDDQQQLTDQRPPPFRLRPFGREAPSRCVRGPADGGQEHREQHDGGGRVQGFHESGGQEVEQGGEADRPGDQVHLAGPGPAASDASHGETGVEGADRHHGAGHGDPVVL